MFLLSRQLDSSKSMGKGKSTRDNKSPHRYSHTIISQLPSSKEGGLATRSVLYSLDILVWFCIVWIHIFNKRSFLFFIFQQHQ